MIDIISTIFKNRKLNPDKLIEYGFSHKKECYSYNRILEEADFIMTVTISKEGEVSAEITDPIINEVYVLHLAEGAVGSFVGNIRTRYQEILTDIAEKCYESDVFKANQARRLIAYVRDKYGDELEFLWKRTPNNAVWRRKDTKKWYAAILTVTARKLGIDADDVIEIIDLRIDPEELGHVIDHEKYYPGYHMNKKYWCTVILDDTVSDGELYQRIEHSYQLAIK